VNIDQRLEARTQTVELLAAMQHDNKKRREKRWGEISKALQEDGEHIRALVRVAELHHERFIPPGRPTVGGLSNMPNPRYDEAKRSAQALGPADQSRLIAELVVRLSGELDRQPRRSLLELQGLGKGVWQGVNVDEYLRRERSSWNG
jgi:hypothetical protein